MRSLFLLKGTFHFPFCRPISVHFQFPRNASTLQKCCSNEWLCQAEPLGGHILKEQLLFGATSFSTTSLIKLSSCSFGVSESLENSLSVSSLDDSPFSSKRLNRALQKRECFETQPWKWNPKSVLKTPREPACSLSDRDRLRLHACVQDTDST